MIQVQIEQTRSEKVHDAFLTDEELALICGNFAHFLNDIIPSLKTEAVNVSLYLSTAHEMQELNRTYRGLDDVTDVLSFPMWEDHTLFVPPEGWRELPLGDIVLCTEYILKRAEEEHLDYNQDLRLMIAHGLLHLVGFDHDTELKKEKMWAQQEKLLQKEV